MFRGLSSDRAYAILVLARDPSAIEFATDLRPSASAIPVPLAPARAVPG